MYVLGISCFYHDAAACLVKDGTVVAAAEEERFSREKHDNSFPRGAITFCMNRENITSDDIDNVVFYEKPLQKFDRVLETAADVFPRGYLLFSQILPEWLGTKLRIQDRLEDEIGYTGSVEFVEHHHSHAASAFYPSPFDEAAVLTVDGVGEWTTNQLFYADSSGIQPLQHISFPDSIGLLYSTITAFLGFMVNNDEYKVMGLAAYGKPRFRDAFEQLITINDNGSYTLNQDFFAYRHRQKMWSSEMEELLGEPRSQGEKLTQRHKDIAATLQEVLEDVLKRQIQHLYAITDTENLCMAGGVALNSAANGSLLDSMPFENLWIQPAAGDDGGAMGAALERSRHGYEMNNVYLGPEHSVSSVKDVLSSHNASYDDIGRGELCETVAARIADGDIVGLFQGRLEWGPRALGNRSILADPRKAEMVDIINQKVKFRESFRPFAPTVLADYADEYFDVVAEHPYMLVVRDVLPERQSHIPAVTHVDGTSRIQTLQRETNPFYYDLIDAFYQETGVPVVLNTSFNLKGMPIVNTPEEAYDCFQQSGMDAVVFAPTIIAE